MSLLEMVRGRLWPHGRGFTVGQIQTFTGVLFNVLNPSPHDVYVADIAASLSKLCRFNGHTSYFYSVAQHSVYASYLVPAEHALAALLHDATEAYIGDMTRPLKRVLVRFVRIEARLWLAISRHFDLAPVLPACVHRADDSLLVCESMALMRRPITIAGVEPANVLIGMWTPEQAQRAFLRRFDELTGIRARHAHKD